MPTPNAPVIANAPTFDRRWTETGAQLFDAARATREGHNYATGRDAVVAGIDRLTWVEIAPGGVLDLPFSPGEAINALICGLALRDVRRIAWDGSVQVRDDAEGSRSLYSLLGIEVGERGGLLRLYAVDRGTDVLPVAYDRIPAPATVAKTSTVRITAAELRRGDVVLTEDGSRAYAAFDLSDTDGTGDVTVWTALADQAAGQPAQVTHEGSDALTVARPTA